MPGTRKECMKSQTHPISRIVPLDVASARAMGWSLTGGVAGTVQPAIAPDVPDNRNQTPGRFRLAYFYRSKTIARYTNDVDLQASVEFEGPALACGGALE
ncbi:hypothetical protein G6M14_25735 [Agrobacterium tumefaciens]|uniref:hypothetical protein n=1 Tax=Agrobacterium tumefaciens complex TaxID=1183400 RepID=UPI0015720B3E|nr:hypothetical protein [Agrobacterium fabrum]NSZ09776.1 hypothetical protein [Agrobacterium tumefaciens]